MDLKFIKERVCPVCGCDLVVCESVEQEERLGVLELRKHAHGGLWETRKFACGQKLEYSPNFRRTEISNYEACRRDPKRIDQAKKQEEAKTKVATIILELTDVDESFKKRLLSAVQSLSSHI